MESSSYPRCPSTVGIRGLDKWCDCPSVATDFAPERARTDAGQADPVAHGEGGKDNPEGMVKMAGRPGVDDPDRQAGAALRAVRERW